MTSMQLAPKKRPRARAILVRVDDHELAMAHRLANDRDEPMTMLVRRLLRDAYAARFGVEKPSVPKRAR